MEILAKKRLAQAVGACLMVGVLQGTAWAAPSLSQPGQDIEPQAPKPEAEVHDDTPTGEGLQEEVHFKVENFRLEAPELHIAKEPLVKILQDGMKEDQTLTGLNETIRQITGYCRQHGYPAAAAYLPPQTSTDGVVILKVIPGRYGEVKIDNQSKLKESVIQGFLRGLTREKGKIIRTEDLETTLFSLSDASGNKAVGVLSPGQEFGTSDLTVRIEKGKSTNTILYVENYGSKNTGRYRYGLQHSMYDVGGTGARINVGALISNHHLHNYYANYEAIVGHGGTTLGLGYSRMDYHVGGGLSSIGAKGTADTISLFGHRPIYHLHDRQLNVNYGFDYRKLHDEIEAFNFDTKKHSSNIHVGVDGFLRVEGLYFGYGLTARTGWLGADSPYGEQQVELAGTKGNYSKLEANVTAVKRLGNMADIMVKASGQVASKNLDGSEELYLGGANAIRAYPQGTGSGDEGVLATAELRFYTPVKGLVFSTYYDTGFVKYFHDGGLYQNRDGATDSSIHLQGWGVGLSYTAPGDWFARLDYARRIGGSKMLTDEEKAKGRLWFMAGKIW